MKTEFPKNGLLSGMIIPAAVGAITIPLGILSPNFLSHFASPMSPALLAVFFASIVVMAVHKLESFWFEEYEQCPVYQTSARLPWAQNPRKLIFLTFVPIFLGMMGLAFLAFLGPPWHLLILTTWLGQGLHELHHVAKSLARRRAYPGVVSSVLFVAVMNFGLFPLWHDAVFGARGLFFHAYYAVMPLVLLAYWREDRRWIAQAPRSIWAPDAPSRPADALAH